MKSTIDMAHKAGIDDPESDWMFWNAMERFAELVRADERNSWPAEMEAMERQVNILTDALAKRKPLTDEEIMKVWQPVARKIFGIVAEGHSMDVYGIRNASMILHLSRAIEAAHGIKEHT
jgi:hypothetical protein